MEFWHLIIIRCNMQAFHCHCECSKCPLLALTQAFSRFEALLIGHCGRLPQKTWSASLNSVIVFGFVLSLDSRKHFRLSATVTDRRGKPPTLHPHASNGFRSGEFGSFDEIWTVGLQPVLCVLRTVCASVPSCWKMNTVGSRRLQSSTRFGTRWPM